MKRSRSIRTIPGVCVACTLRLANAGIRTLRGLDKANPQVVLDRITARCMAAIEEAKGTS